MKGLSPDGHLQDNAITKFTDVFLVRQRTLNFCSVSVWFLLISATEENRQKDDTQNRNCHGQQKRRNRSTYSPEKAFRNPKQGESCYPKPNGKKQDEHYQRCHASRGIAVEVTAAPRVK